MTAAAGAPPAPPAGRAVAVGILLPAAAGAASVLGFAPFYFWPAPIAGLAVLYFAWTRSGSPLQGALSGFAFGLGFFMVGVSWVFVSLHRFGSMPLLLAALATFLFCAYLAGFFALAGAAVARWGGPLAWRRLALAAAATALLEWLRGWLFTGFPWLNLGTSQVPGSPLAGFAPLSGAYGTTLAVAVAAALLAGLVAAPARARVRIGLAAALGALLLAGGAARSVQWSQPAGEPVTVALLQGNVPQELKWRPEVRIRTIEDYRRRIFEADARIVVIPETALPAFLDELPEGYLDSLRAHARERNKEIVLGTVEREFRGEGYVYYNSVLRLNGEAPRAYRKRHLVPFGEFIPPGFRWILAVLHIPLSDFDAGADRQAPLVAAGVPFGVAICYEDIFGEEVIDFLPQARALLNVSNDAWFGESFAADQHLQASQMRAAETGRWMVRSTNTGATAAIDERGRVVSRLPAFTAGTLVAAIQPRVGLTPYARFGNAPAVLLAAVLAALATGAWRRRA